jgi:hypothetical protein
MKKLRAKKINLKLEAYIENRWVRDNRLDFVKVQGLK